MNNLKLQKASVLDAQKEARVMIGILRLIKRRVTEQWIEGISEEYIETIQEIEESSYKIKEVI